MRILTTDDPNADGDLEYPNPPAPTGITLTPRIRPHHHVRSPIKIRWEAVDDAPAYRVRYRKDGGTAWVNPNRQPRAAHPWPNMHDAEPGPQPQRPPPQRISIQKLEENQRYEVQVATCTDTSCGSTGPWSASQYATAR